ncbi:MAG TPA: hypothetical protein VMN39_12060 [Longimicrobiaceae bacterium]|nr:hypothetical protein [Longimicrobiaceae bacterium]
MSSSYDSAVVDTATIDDTRMLALPRGVRLLHIEALVWCKLRRTDGLIPRGALPRMTDESDPADAASRLVRAGLWETHEAGWTIVGFTESQMSREQVERKVQLARKARDRYEDRHPDRPRRGKKGKSKGGTDASPEGSRDATDLPTASLPARGRQVGRKEAADGSAPAGGPPPPPKMMCPSCRLYFIDEDAHECPPSVSSVGGDP